MRIIRYIPLALTSIAIGLPCAAADNSQPSKAQPSAVFERLVRTYQEGAWDLYLTGYAFHGADGYTKAQRKRLNAYTYGGGIGKRSSDSSGEDLIYAMAFIDSHKDLQPVIGYAHQWFTRPMGSLSFGAGVTAALTARADIFHYMPFPVLLPLTSIRLGHASIMGIIIPKIPGLTIHRGTIAFFWGRYSF